VSEKNDIFYDGALINLDDIRTTVATSLKVTPKLQIILNADQKTPYQMVVSILDKIRLGGCFDIVLEAEKASVHDS